MSIEELVQVQECLSRLFVPLLTRIEDCDPDDVASGTDHLRRTSDFSRRYPTRPRHQTPSSAFDGGSDDEFSDQSGQSEAEIEIVDLEDLKPLKVKRKGRPRSMALNGVTAQERMSYRPSKGERTCTDCGQEFSTIGLLGRHAETHGNFTPFVCGLCKVPFGDAALFRAHRVGDHPRQVFSKEVKLKRRSAKVEWTPADHVCHYCGKKWPSALDLREHKVVHYKALVSKCELCGITCKSKEVLRHHFQVIHLGFKHTGSQKKMRQRLNESRDLSQDEVKAPFVTCDLCGKLFWWQWKLDEHKVRAHGFGTGHVGKPFQCAECSMFFASKNQLSSHLNSKKHRKDKPLICETCGKTYRKVAGLRKHIAREHPEVPLPRRFQYGPSDFSAPDLNRSIFDDIVYAEAPFEADFATATENPTHEAVNLENEAISKLGAQNEELENNPPPETRSLEVEVVTKIEQFSSFETTENYEDYVNDNFGESESDVDFDQKFDSERLRRLRRACKRRRHQAPPEAELPYYDIAVKVKIEEDDEEEAKVSIGSRRKASTKRRRRTTEGTLRAGKKKDRKPDLKIKCRLKGCRFRANDRAELQSHRLEVHGRADLRSYKFKCTEPSCTFRARFLESYESHLLTHKDMYAAVGHTETSKNGASAPPAQKLKYPYPCTFDDCTKGFSHRIRLVAHLENIHGKISESGVKIAKTKKLTEPRIDPDPMQPFSDTYKVPRRCRLHGCRFVAAKRSELEAHRLEAHGSAFARTIRRQRFKTKFTANRPWLYCAVDACTFRALLPESIASHKRKAHDQLPPIANYACPHCDKVFSTNGYRQVHVDQKHGAQPSTFPRVPCMHCARNFSCRLALFNHLQREHGDKPTYPCDMCTKIFYFEDERTLHEERHKRFSKLESCTYKCAVFCCKVNCPNLEDLQAHVRAAHDVPIDQRTICPICGKECLTYGYTAHARTHAPKEKKFECEYCSKKFGKRIQMERHHETAHAELFEGMEKSYICDSCGAGFFSQASFNLHRYRHHGKSPKAPNSSPAKRAPNSKVKTRGAETETKPRRKRRTKEEMMLVRESAERGRKVQQPYQNTAPQAPNVKPVIYNASHSPEMLEPTPPSAHRQPPHYQNYHEAPAAHSQLIPYFLQTPHPPYHTFDPHLYH